MKQRMASPLDLPNPLIEEFMRGSLIQYQEESAIKGTLAKWYTEVVWGTSTDNDGRDIVEIGKYGCNGYLDLSVIRGIDLTEEILLDYGFLQVNKQSSLITFYRDDIGYLKLSVYGVECLFTGGKPIKYLHSFQRVFFDYTGKRLSPKTSEPPKVEKKLSFEFHEKKTGDQILKEIAEIETKYSAAGNVNFELDDEMQLPEDVIRQKKIDEAVKLSKAVTTVKDISFDFD